MRLRLVPGVLVGALATLVLLAGCSTENPALAPAEDALAATETAILAVEQEAEGKTLGTVTETTLGDMLAAVTDSEASVAEIPRNAGSRDALDAVRSAGDAIGEALTDVQNGTDTTDAAAALSAARAALDSAVTSLRVGS